MAVKHKPTNIPELIDFLNVRGNLSLYFDLPEELIETIQKFEDHEANTEDLRFLYNYFKPIGD